MALTYGMNVKQKDYNVHIGLASTTNLSTAIATFTGTQNKTNWDAITSKLSRLGELRADSISVTAENGDTVEGNNVGEIVLNKACAMAAEMLNTTAANLAELLLLDGASVTVTLTESGTHAIDGSGSYKTCILINGIVMSYTENITGGDIPRASISLSRNVGSVTEFRKVYDVSQA